MNRFFLTIIALSIACLSYGQDRRNRLFQNYIDQYKDLAIEEMLRYRIPASITLAQGLLESGAGQSDLARKGNNHFGIKCHDWQGNTVYHDDDATQECFRSYNTVKESFEDHSKFLANKQRYKRLFDLNTDDYKGWAHGLKECGYATNPQYAYRLISIIEQYQLYVYDKATSYNEFMASHAGADLQGAAQGFHTIYAFNKNYYIIARQGDSFQSIAKEVELSAKHLAHVNERNVKDILEDGEIIYLKKKQKRAPKKYKDTRHIVQPNESMYSIAQRYGMKVASLYHLNNLDYDYTIQVGDKLRVY